MSETTSGTGKKNTNKTVSPVAGLSRATIKKLGRDKRKTKLKTDATYATAFFEARSKRAIEKKAAFRKKKSGKKTG
jgi:hypothetical protein